jgi:hypothetical protein
MILGLATLDMLYLYGFSDRSLDLLLPTVFSGWNAIATIGGSAF